MGRSRISCGTASTPVSSTTRVRAIPASMLLPARHRELAMVLPGDMSADRNIVGIVGEDETSLRVRHQPRQHVGVAGVAAGNPMSAEREDVTRPGDRLERGVRLKWAVLGDLGL